MNSILEFKDNARIECARADRYGIRLSMAVYEIGIEDEKNLLVRSLVRTLFGRVRNIDQIGWFDSGQIGVLLPHTPADGASKLAQDIYDLMASLSSPPPFTIYTYPSKTWPIPPQDDILKLSSLSSFTKSLFSAPSITSREEMRILLGLELDRASRYDHLFAMIIFHSVKLRKKNLLRKLVKTLNHRLRETDEFGWYDENDIAVILPYATSANAQQIASTICAITSINEAGCYTVYGYPDNWFKETTDCKAPIYPMTNQERLYNPDQRNSHIQDFRINKKGNNNTKADGLQCSEIENFIATPMPTWKRIMDVVLSLLSLIIFSPFFFIAALGIKLTSKGNIFFLQNRIGYKMKSFPLIKFRTMYMNSNAELHRKFMMRLIAENDDQPDTKMSDDPRIFPFGLFLRKTSLDELPQLINVLKGEMSLVGPRPCLDYEAEKYLRWHTKRFHTMPGITGLWQVSGKNKLSFKQMVRLDIHYEKNLSFWLDLKILLKTIPAVFSIFRDKQI